MAKSEFYGFEVEGKAYTLQFLRMKHLEGYTAAQLASLALAECYEISFRLEGATLPSGTHVAGYGDMGTGHPFQVLSGVANGLAEWTARTRAPYLFWYAEGARRQRLYARMVRLFAEQRDSGYVRLPADPFTGAPCDTGTFWLGFTKHPLVSLE